MPTTKKVPQPLFNAVAQAISDYIDDNGISASKFAGYIGCNHATISLLLGGPHPRKPKSMGLKKIAACLPYIHQYLTISEREELYALLDPYQAFKHVPESVAPQLSVIKKNYGSIKGNNNVVGDNNHVSTIRHDSESVKDFQDFVKSNKDISPKEREIFNNLLTLYQEQ